MFYGTGTQPGSMQGRVASGFELLRQKNGQSMKCSSSSNRIGREDPGIELL